MGMLFLIVFTDLVGFGVIIPLLPFYAEHFSASPTTVGLLMATYSLAQFITAPMWGRWSDRVGRRPVLLISLLGSMLAYIALAFANHLWLLFAARAVGGAMAGNIAAAFAYVADITTTKNRARGMGMIGAAFGLGFIFGPAIGGILAGSDPHNANFTQPALVAAGLSALAFVLTLAILPESLSNEARARIAATPAPSRWRALAEALRRPTVGLVIVLAFLATFAFAGLEATFAMWSKRQFGWGPEQNGYLFALIGLISAAIQGGLVGRLAKHLGEARMVIVGAGALAIGMALIPLSTTLPLLVVAMIIAAIGFSLISPALVSLVSLRVGADVQGGTLGVNRSATTLARVLGPSWAGLIFGLLGRNAPFFAGAVLMLVVLVLAFRLVRHPPDGG